METAKFRILLFSTVTALAIGLTIAFMLPFVYVFGWAAVLAVVTKPIYRWLLRRLRNPSIAAFTACLVVVLIVIAPAILLGVQVGQELRDWAVSSRSDVPRVQPASASEVAHDAMDRLREWVKKEVEFIPIDLDSALRQTSGQMGTYVARQGAVLARRIAWGTVQLALILITMFFLLRDGNQLRRAVGLLVPLDDPDIETMLTRLIETVHATLFGNLMVALAQGALAGLAYWTLGIQAPLLWTVLTSLLCLVPLVGAPAIWIPLSLSLVLQGAYGKAVFLILWGMFVVGMIDNVLRPLIIGARTRQHPLPVFFSIFGSVLLFGPIGIVLGPVVVSVTLSLLEILINRMSSVQPAPALPPSTN